MPVRLTICLFSLVLACAAWLPCVHLFFVPDLDDYRGPAEGRANVIELAERHLDLWAVENSRAAEIDAMRESNPEWDFMGRTFLVMSLANMAISEPDRQAEYLAVMDHVIDDTLRVESERGMYYFLLDYARNGPFLVDPKRSLFVDGEIAMMLASRQTVQVADRYKPLLADRINTVVAQMQAGPVNCAESYPDECWIFCNTVAVAAVRMSDAIDGRDHSTFVRDWLVMAKDRLVDPKTGLLVSSFTVDGRHLDGPEGSSIWMAVHCLRFVDDDFARDQYARAKTELGVTILGFGFAREWPHSWEGVMDVDSGPVIPFLDASPGSSGLALVGAGAFDDEPYLRELLTTVHFAAFPVREDGQMRFAASNQVGDAVMLYACVQGPLLERITEGNTR